MKKQLGAFVAILLAVGATAFTTNKTSAYDPVYDWMVYDASGNPTGTFLEDKTEAQVRAANPNCNANNINCFQNYSQDHLHPLGTFIRKS